MSTIWCEDYFRCKFIDLPNKDKSIHFKGSVYETEDNDDENERVESVFHEKIYALLKEERKQK